MPWAIIAGAALGGMGSIAGAAIGANSAQGAAQTQAQAATQAAQAQAEASTYATNAQIGMFNQQQQNLQPWLQAGQFALPQLASMASNPSQFSFTPQDFTNNMDPAYQFDMQQGLQAVNRSAAASGQLMSGGTMKDLNNYAQGMASNEYQNAYNRAFNTFQYNQNNQFNRLASLAGLGQTATGQEAGLASNTASNIGGIAMNNGTNLANIYTGLANAQGASQIAQGNIWSSGLSGLSSDIGSGLQTYGIMNMLKNGAKEV